MVEVSSIWQEPRYAKYTLRSDYLVSDLISFLLTEKGRRGADEFGGGGSANPCRSL